jgi:hypothetical protein
MFELINTIFKEATAIRLMAKDLERLGDAFFLTGNSTVSDTLNDIASALIESSNNLDQAVNCFAAQPSNINPNITTQAFIAQRQPFFNESRTTELKRRVP